DIGALGPEPAVGVAPAVAVDDEAPAVRGAHVDAVAQDVQRAARGGVPLTLDARGRIVARLAPGHRAGVRRRVVEDRADHGRLEGKRLDLDGALRGLARVARRVDGDRPDRVAAVAGKVRSLEAHQPGPALVGERLAGDARDLDPDPRERLGAARHRDAGAVFARIDDVVPGDGRDRRWRGRRIVEHDAMAATGRERRAGGILDARLVL